MKEHFDHPSRSSYAGDGTRPGEARAASPQGSKRAAPPAAPADTFDREALEKRLIMDYAESQKSKQGKTVLSENATSSIKLFAGVALLFIVPLLIAIYLSGNIGGGGDDVPVIKAEEGPVRIKPDNPGGFFIDHQDKSIYDSLRDGRAEELPQVARILPETEMPANLAQTDEGHQMLDDGESNAAPVEAEDDVRARIIRLGAAENVPADETLESAPEEEPAPESIADLVDIVRVPPGTAPDAGPVLTEKSAFAEQETPVTGEAAPEGVLVPYPILKEPTPRIIQKPRKQASIASARANAPAAPAVMPPSAGENRMLKAGARGRYVQLGAFSTVADAKRRFEQLAPRIRAGMASARTDYYFQPVNVSGKTLYRLKIGEFAGHASARSFCENLNKNNIECIYVGY